MIPRAVSGVTFEVRVPMNTRTRGFGLTKRQWPGHRPHPAAALSSQVPREGRRKAEGWDPESWSQ